MHNDLIGLPFKKGTMATAFKFDYEYELNSDGFKVELVFGFSEVTIASGGKKVARYEYDGSLFENYFDKRIGSTIEYDVDPSPILPVSQNSFGMGRWLLIPNAAITEAKPIAYWIDVAKSDFIFSVERLDLNVDVTNQLKQLLTEAVVQSVSVDEWNDSRLSIIPEWKRRFYSARSVDGTN